MSLICPQNGIRRLSNTQSIGQDSIQALEIDDGGKVAALQAGTSNGKIIGGDAFVYYDGRLLAVAVDSEVRYEFGSAITDPVPIDQIRAALERMNMIELDGKSY